MFNIEWYKRRLETCACLSHEMGRAWSAVTKGESYIVFGITVTSAKGAGAYLGKYLSKDMFEKTERRFRKSNGWPGEKRRRLLPGPDGWKRAQWSFGGAPTDIEDKWDNIPRSGTDKQKVESRRAAAKRLIRRGETDVYRT